MTRRKCSKKCPAYVQTSAGGACTLHMFNRHTESGRKCAWQYLNGEGNDGFITETKSKVEEYRRSLNKGKKPALRSVRSCFTLERHEIEELAMKEFKECLQLAGVKPRRGSVNLYWDHREVVIDFDTPVTSEKNAREVLKKAGYCKEDIDELIEDEYRRLGVD